MLGTAASTLYCLIARRHQSASDSDGRLQSSRCSRIIDCGSSRSAIFSFVVNLEGPSLKETRLELREPFPGPCARAALPEERHVHRVDVGVEDRLHEAVVGPQRLERGQVAVALG